MNITYDIDAFKLHEVFTWKVERQTTERKKIKQKIIEEKT